MICHVLSCSGLVLRPFAPLAAVVRGASHILPFVGLRRFPGSRRASLFRAYRVRACARARAGVGGSAGDVMNCHGPVSASAVSAGPERSFMRHRSPFGQRFRALPGAPTQGRDRSGERPCFARIAGAPARGRGRAYRGGAVRARDCARETAGAPSPSAPAGVFFAAPSHRFPAQKRRKAAPEAASLYCHHTLDPPGVKPSAGIKFQTCSPMGAGNPLPGRTEARPCLASSPQAAPIRSLRTPAPARGTFDPCTERFREKSFSTSPRG